MKISEEQKGKAKIFTVEGRLDSNTSKIFEEHILNVIKGGEQHIIIDCHSLDYISSAGVRVLIHFHKILKDKGTFILVAVPQKIQHVLQITGFLPIFIIVEKISDALEKTKIT